MDLPPSLVGTRHEAFARSVLATLSAPQKSIEPRWLYDAVGAKLFEAITQLDHYYPTRTEMALLLEAAGEIAEALGEGVTIVEPGSGEALKVRPLLDALGPAAIRYVPIDIAADQLASIAAELGALYPALAVEPVAADFFLPFAMPHLDRAVVFFPGSTVGNMTPSAGQAFLTNIMSSANADRLLVGFDLVKDRRLMLDAYDDPAGVTAAFAKNILQRANRELRATFDLTRFTYRARFDEAKSAIEMSLVSEARQTVAVAGQPFEVRRGEAIHTEDSRKFTKESFADFAAGAGLTPVRCWSDRRDWFAVMLLERR